MDMDISTKSRVREAIKFLEDSEYRLDQFGEGNKAGVGRARTDIRQAREVLDEVLKESRQEQDRRRQLTEQDQ